jgi:uncharacterized protein
MSEPRWLVDEMLGRLARYLRFLGYDTAYVRGVGDDEIVRHANAEGRRVITRDRSLSRQLPDAVLLTRTDIAGQMQELRGKVPALRADIRFDRCSDCNGLLSMQTARLRDSVGTSGLPPEVREGRTALFACTRCGHLYWEGSHTRAIRRRVGEWLPAGVVPE